MSIAATHGIPRQLAGVQLAERSPIPRVGGDVVHDKNILEMDLELVKTCIRLILIQI